MQRNWMAVGVRNARRKATDNDKIGRKFRAEASEKQAAKARQTQRMIERLDVVEEPRKEWELRMTIAVGPALRHGRRGAARGRGAPWRLHARPGGRAGRLGRPRRHHRRERLRQVDAAGRAARADPRRRRAPQASGPACASGEIDQARGLFLGPEPLARAFGDAVPDWPDVGRAHPAGEVRADRGARAAAGGVALPRRADARGAGPAPGPRGEPAGPRRADQPPRPARDRAARTGARRASPARSCWSPTTAGCWTRCAPRGAGRSTAAGSRRPDAQASVRGRRSRPA